MSLAIVVIGAGPGGEAAAKRAASKGAQVTVVEKRDLGGLCLNRGCIPSKTLLEAGRLLSQVRAAGEYVKGQNGLHVQWDLLQKKKEAVVSSMRSAVGQNFKRLGIRLLQGDAAFLDAKTLRVRTAAGEQSVPFDRAVIATGSHPFFPPPFDALRERLLDSDKALELPRLPARTLIVGGGAVGCEFACLFRELGGEVSIVEMTGTLLPGEDAAVVRTLRQAFEKRGIAVRTGATVRALAAGKGAWKAEFSDGSAVDAEEVLVCVGRRPDVRALGIEKAGVKEEKGRLAVNEFLQTSVPSIYAVGDVNGLSLLAHAAAVQGEVAADHALGEQRAYLHHLVPRCLYTWPEVASVGEWTHTAAEKGLAPKSQRFFFQGSAKAMASNEPEGFIQVVSENGGRLLGAQIIGPHATELIHIFAVALQGGLTAEQLRSVIYAHPTLAEGVKEALSR